ncbi:MAG TPA: hypothetical protein ENK49_00735 [Gammaproteobacteria bacterium]|nr:hypothetical protein [Gammaproteobacteria bacterium]
MPLNSRMSPGKPGKDATSGTRIALFPAAVTLLVLPLLYMIYQQALGGYQTDDYSLAWSFIDSIMAMASDTVSRVSAVLTGALGGGKVHWTPVTNVLLYFTLDDDRLVRVLIVNLAVVLAMATAVATFARAMGAGRVPAALAGAWAGTSQALVFAVTSVWGVMNLLAPLLGMLASFMLWRWVSMQCGGCRVDRRLMMYCAGFLLLFLLALFTKETEIRCALTAALGGIVLLVCNRSATGPGKVIGLLVAVFTVVILYFALRYFLTDAQVPLLRTPEEVAQTYHQPRMSLIFFAKNIAQLLLGSLTPVNSYHIYLLQKNGLSWQLLLSLLPAVALGLALVTGYIWLYLRSSQEDRLVLAFCGVFVFSSLFPEALLGKVSEIYAMATLWPLALTGALVFGRISGYNRPAGAILSVAAAALITTNVYQAKGKVSEYMVTSDYAHSMRLSMLELTGDLPAGSRIGLVYQPRSSLAFGPFGEKGIHASGARPRITPHQWTVFEKGKESDAICDMDLVLEESEDRTRVQVMEKYKNSVCGKAGKGDGNAHL